MPTSFSSARPHRLGLIGSASSARPHRLGLIGFSLACLISFAFLLFGSPAAVASIQPPILTATAGNGQVVLSWSSVTQVRSYQLTRTVTGSSGPNPLIYNTYIGAANDANPNIAYVGAGWTYYSNPSLYYTSADDYQGDIHTTPNNGDSASYNFFGSNISYITETNSNEGHVQVYLDGTLQATVNCNSPTLQKQQTVWSINGLSDGSHVLKLVKQDGSYMVLDALSFVASTGPYTDVTVTNGTSYTYQVTALVGKSQVYSSNKVTVTPTAPPGISLALTTAVNNQASLSWSTVPGAASYNVKRSTTSGSGYTTIANVTSPSYLDHGLTNGTPYYYVVTAVSGTTENAPSNQVTATPTAQAFGFLNVGNGSVLSGQTTLYVSMASKAYGSEASPVTFSVDGVVLDTGGDMQESSGNAGANTFFVLATDAFANGPHTLNVKDVNGNSATVNVTFSNVLYNVSIPNMFDASGGDGLPTSAAIAASLTSAQPWTVSIVTVDSASSVVQSFNGNSANINVSWNGKNSQGVEVADDAYEVDISYGSATQSTATGTITPLLGSGIIRRNLLSKNKIGDCFIMLDQDVFPSGPDMIAYLKTIKADLAPSKGIVWNNFSCFPYSTSKQPGLNANEVQRIDNHFKQPLTVFYVDSHGGIGTPGNGNGTFFRIGGHSWRSNTFSSPISSAMATLTQSANYGVNNPPALVFIDSCDSASPNPSHPYSPDLGFSDDFDIGDGPSGFLGWNGFAVPYGAAAPPYDDWTFWRLDLWAQFTNFNQTYDTAYSKLQRDYNTHGHRGGYDSGNGLIFPDQTMVVNWLSGSAF